MTESPNEPSAGPSRPSTNLQPLQNPRFRHISRSAAKRESVQLLGSIKDLQAHFSRALGVEHKAGSGVGVRGLGTLGEEGEEDDVAIRREPKPRLQERRPWKEVELPRVDPDQAKDELRQVMISVKEQWGIQSDLSGPGGSTATTPSTGGMTRSPTVVKLSPGTDTRHMLISTAQAVRRVRELSLALISQPGRRVSGPSSALSTRGNAGRSSISTPSRPNVSVVPRVSSSTLPQRQSSLSAIGEAESDYLADLRKAALEVLAGLRSLEERLRIRDDSPSLQPTPSGEPGRGSAQELSVPTPQDSRPASALSSLVSEPDSYNTTPGEENDDLDFNLNLMAADVDLHKHLQTWEERIVAESRTYREPAEGEGVGEREAIKWWCGVVEGLFLRAVEPEEGGRGKWVDAAEWEGRELERIHDFITSHLPLEIEMHVPSLAVADFRSAFLSRLSDGYILLVALNAALHRSPKPWGFVSTADIHDTLAPGSGEEEGGDWTFRRVGNLTAWAAAIKHRHSLPLLLAPSPAQPLTYLQSTPLPSVRDPTSHRPAGRPIAQPIPKGPAQVAPYRKLKREHEGEGGIPLDPLLVAKKGEGWKEMLEGVLRAWVMAAAHEVGDTEAGQGISEGDAEVKQRGGWV